MLPRLLLRRASSRDPGPARASGSTKMQTRNAIITGCPAPRGRQDACQRRPADAQHRNQTGLPLSFPSVPSTHVHARNGTKTPSDLLIHVNRKNQAEKRCCKEKKLPPRRGGASASGASSSSHSNRPRPNAGPSIQAGHVAQIQERTRNGFLQNK